MNATASVGSSADALPTVEVVTRAVPIFLLLIAIDTVYCHVIAKNGDYRFNDTVASMSLGTMSRILGIFVRALTVIPYSYVHDNFRVVTFDSHSLSTPVIVLLLIAIDLGYYTGHRLAHATNLSWGGHISHHSSEEYNLSTALRQNAFETAFAWIPFLPLALFVDSYLFRYWFEWNLLWQFWVHTKRIGRMPDWFEYIFVTPSHHRVHHAVNPCYIDKNFGGMFIVWDRLFGTYADETVPCVYGNTHPLRSFDALWASVHHFFDVYDRLRLNPGKRVETSAQKIKLLWKGPGYSIKTDSYYPAPAVDHATFKRFDPPLTLSIQAYVIVQFGIVTVATLALPALSKHWNVAPSVVAAALLAWSLAALGRLTDGRQPKRFFKLPDDVTNRTPFAVQYETVRLLVIAATAGVVRALYSDRDAIVEPLTTAAVVYAAVSAVVFLLFVRSDCAVPASYVPIDNHPPPAAKTAKAPGAVPAAAVKAE